MGTSLFGELGDGRSSNASQVSPPPPTQPDPPVFVPVKSRAGSGARLAVSTALASAALGWAVWLYGAMAESDTGRPNGLGCSGQRGPDYDSCMRSSEIGGLAAWSMTLGLAILGLVVLVRSRHTGRHGLAERSATVVAVLASASLAGAGVAVWLQGIRGRYYDDLIGPAWWNIGMLVGLVVGLVVGLLIPFRTTEGEV